MVFQDRAAGSAGGIAEVDGGFFGFLLNTETA